MMNGTNLGQEAAKEMPFELKAESFDEASEFRCRSAVILPRETAHLSRLGLDVHIEHQL